MNVILMAATLVLASVTVVSPLAGVLEVAGDPQLSRERYVAVRGMYYPGFTLAGVAEPLSILALCVLLASLPHTKAFWLVALALAAEIFAHLLYWVLIVPMNVWLSGETHARRPRSPASSGDLALQDRWERCHACRAVVSAAAFVLLVAATLARG